MFRALAKVKIVVIVRRLKKINELLKYYYSQNCVFILYRFVIIIHNTYIHRSIPLRFGTFPTKFDGVVSKKIVLFLNHSVVYYTDSFIHFFLSCFFFFLFTNSFIERQWGQSLFLITIYLKPLGVF